MDARNTWNNICNRITKKYHNSSEKEFQDYAITIFDKLGWSELDGEIITQRTISIGSAGSLRPDIIISNGKNDLLVVELKKPNLQTSERNVSQIVSYMKQLKLNFGILLGESLQIFYDSPNDNKDPQKIHEICFDLNSEDGNEIIELLSKDDYSPENVDNYCKKIVAHLSEEKKVQKYIEILCSKEGTGIITDLLKEKLSLNFSEKSVLSIISRIDIQIIDKSDNTKMQTTVKETHLNQPLSPATVISKSKAMSLISKKYSKTLNDSNTMYSTVNAQVKQWSFNRQNDDFSKDIHIILINQDIRELHYFFIPKCSIENPKEIFDQRNDDFRTDCSKIYILLDTYNFKEKNSGFPFGDFKKETIKY